jgi:hypothetical protein
MKTKLGKLTLEHLMRVQQLDIGDKTYKFPKQPTLSAGQYEIWADGNQVEFVKIGEYAMDAEDDALLANLLERGEHQ